MINSTNSYQTLSIAITEANREKAHKFAQQQPNPNKQKQVYLNTLAVLVVHHYLEMLDIATDLKSSYIWNRVLRLCADVADLKITDTKLYRTGHIECRPVEAGAQFAYIPPEVWDDRIGYVFVQFDPDYHQGTLLGFLPTVFREQISIERLEPLVKFLEVLYQPAIKWLRLSDWFDKIYPTGWQAIEAVINNRGATPALAFRLGRVHFDKRAWLRQQIQQLSTSANFRAMRSSVDFDPIPVLSQIIETAADEETRWKAAEMLWEIEPNHPVAGARQIIDLGMQLGGYPVALMVAILQKPDQKVAVLLRVYPMGSEDSLPPRLKLTACNVSNPEQVAEVESREQPKDNCIQLKLLTDYGDRFSVTLSLEAANITEYFVV